MNLIFASQLSTEREIVDLEHETGRAFFNSMDSFFAYGLLSGDKVYWRFVREFLPKTQQQLLRAEWGDIDNRRLSLAWLKDAFNKGTLHFQMLAFKNNRKFIERFYHRNACMCNGGMLEAVTDMIMSLVNVQFAFYSTLNLREEPAQAVIVEAPVTQFVTARAKRRKRTESLRNQPPVLNDKTPSDLSDTAAPSSIDQDAILDELMRIRRNRLHGIEETPSKEKVQENSDSGMTTSGNSSGGTVKTEGFEEVVRKTMSLVRMENLGEEPKSFDSLLQYDEFPVEKSPDDDTLIEGEVVLHSGDILKLAMNVYVDEGERLISMYHVFQGFTAGTPQQRLLAVTDHNMYVISQNHIEDHSSNGGVYEEGCHNNVFYEVHVVISLPSIDYIGVSPDSQVLTFYAKAGAPFHLKADAEGLRDRACAIATGDVSLGNAIVKSIITAFESGKHEPPPVFTDSTPYSLIIKRYLTKELNGSPHIELRHFALAFWKESSASAGKPSSESVGYLYRRMIHPNWWRKPPAEWTQSYVVLSDCTETHELDSKKDCQWGFELVLPDGNLQLQCPSREEMSKWMQLVNIALNSQSDHDAAACMVMVTDSNMVVAQEGEKCYTDGFIRTLVSFPLPDIRCGWYLRTESHMVLILRVDAMFQWFFFRTNEELNRIVKVLIDYPIPLVEITHNSQEKVASYVFGQCHRMVDLWHKTIFATEGFESES
ncbi:hypothetical protein Q1695_006594 [Nippostrongylus brasiliensis]|nr:hypothetical protein Q1695_006594 [Nippostrongylus brasiliensis]